MNTMITSYRSLYKKKLLDLLFNLALYECMLYLCLEVFLVRIFSPSNLRVRINEKIA